MSTDPYDLASHPGDIYELCVEGELHGKYGMTKQGSSWLPAEHMVEYPDGQLPSEVVTDAYSKYSDVLRDFDEFQQMPRPEQFDGLIDQLETLVSNLSVTGFVDPDTRTAAAPNPVSAQVEDIKDFTSDWQGDAATAFRRNVMNPLAQTTGGMFALAWASLCAVRAERKVWEAAWTSVHQVAHDAIDKLLYRDVSDAGFDQVVGVVTTVSSYIPVVGDAVGIAADALSVLEVLSGGGDPDGLCTYADPDSVLEAMRANLQTLKSTIATEESKIAEGLRNVVATSHENPGLFEMPIPAELRQPALERNPGNLD